LAATGYGEGAKKKGPHQAGLSNFRTIPNYSCQLPTTRGLVADRIKRLNIRTMSNFLLSPVFPLLSEIEIRSTKSLVCFSEHQARVQA
jgi:hypothetical protein